MIIPVYIVDAFTATAFCGNPAAVILSDNEPDPIWMQQMAGEMNLSETAFLWPFSDGYYLRWFTPRCEVGLCGHATLAASHVLITTDRIPSSSLVRFHTKSGLLTATVEGSHIWLDFPATPPLPCELPPGIIPDEVAVCYCGQSCYDLFIHLNTESAVREYQPDSSFLEKLPYRGIIIAAPADTDKPYDIVSRFFAPAVGIAEDPVTGSAHCCIAPYFSQIFKKNEMTGKQVSSREGMIMMKIRDKRVLFGGEAVTVMQGTLCMYA